VWVTCWYGSELRCTKQGCTKVFDIIEISKYMKPNQCIYQKKIMKKFIEVFNMIFQSLMGPRKSRCDVPSGTTQGNLPHVSRLT